MLDKETKQAIKSMQRFVECKQDMSVITANEMKIILQYIEQIEKSDASKEQSSINYYNETKALKQNLDEAWKEWNNLNEYCNQEIQKRNKRIEQLETDKQKLIEKLEIDNEFEKVNVQELEMMRRRTSSKFYKTSYQKKIHVLNARRELRKEILSIVKGESDE